MPAAKPTLFLTTRWTLVGMVVCSPKRVTTCHKSACFDSN